MTGWRGWASHETPSPQPSPGVPGEGVRAVAGEGALPAWLPLPAQRGWKRKQVLALVMQGKSTGEIAQTVGDFTESGVGSSDAAVSYSQGSSKGRAGGEAAEAAGCGGGR